ncbi:interference hedgehog isoform X2 [Monomorium pharaonis]|uniref:interference hedgehog isoform X2 n=1 Tax=Monomorium pharaonis TaxID=307658 RepID=UPI00102E0FFA|nr:interference hedgehog isoform X2 [Monomorium pharaonis]
MRSISLVNSRRSKLKRYARSVLILVGSSPRHSAREPHICLPAYEGPEKQPASKCLANVIIMASSSFVLAECVKMTSISSLCGIVVILLYSPIAYTCEEEKKQTEELNMSFVRHPQPFAAPLSDEMSFECMLNIPAENFVWYHRPLDSSKWIALPEPSNKQPSKPSNNNVEQPIKMSRHIVTVDNETKAGDYRCVAYFGTSGIASDPARLSLATIDKFSDKSDVFIEVEEGNTVPITCPVPYSEPEGIVQFYKNNVLIKDTELANGKTTMVLNNVKLTDSGSYHCSVTNYITLVVLTSNHKTILNVYANFTFQPPYLTKQPQTQYTVPRGKNVTLECFGAGYPVPQVTWSRLGGSLPLKSVKSPNGLTLVHVQPSDRGEYDCAWNNEAGQIKSVIILKVVEPPRVTKPPRPCKTLEGGKLQLSCDVTGEPAPKMEWLINGEPLMPSKTVEMRDSTLIISEVEKKHAGIVQCVASNQYGSHSAYNLLQVKPKEHVIGSKAESKPDYGTVSRHNKHTRGGGRRRNKEGKKKGGAAVLVPPDQPNVTRLSDVSVMVRWSVPENKGLPIQFFKVQYREISLKMNGKQAKWMTANSEIPSHVRSFEVTDLQPDHTYRFRIAAVYSNNDNKLSPNSVRFHLNRDSDIDINKMPIPLLTNTEALGPDQVLLVWQNPDKSAEIDGFYIYHRASTSAGDYLKTTVEGKNACNMTIFHLLPDTTYEFKVQSFSVDAASEFSQILRQKTKKLIVQNPVQQVVAENKLRPNENNKNVSIHVIIGGVFGTSCILIALAFAARFLYKRVKYKQSQESQSEGKPITNGRIMNGGVTDSKINITSNPLAGLDTSEDIRQPKSGQQSSMEMTSFLNGQNNNGSNSGHNNGDAAGSDVNVTSHSEPSSLRQGPLPIEQRL